MTAIQEAEELRQRAIAILISAREEIDAQLATFGQTTGKKRGRPAGKQGQEKDPQSEGQATPALPLR
jgi:hypothetical protein